MPYAVHDGFQVDEHVEITMEMDPGTFDEAQLRQLAHLGINRITYLWASKPSMMPSWKTLTASIVSGTFMMPCNSFDESLATILETFRLT